MKCVAPQCCSTCLLPCALLSRAAACSRRAAVPLQPATGEEGRSVQETTTVTQPGQPHHGGTVPQVGTDCFDDNKWCTACMYTIHIPTLSVYACRHCCKVLQSIPPVVNGLSEHLDNVNWCKGYSLQQSALVHTHTHVQAAMWCALLSCLQSPPTPPPPHTTHVGNKAVSPDRLPDYQ